MRKVTKKELIEKAKTLGIEVSNKINPENKNGIFLSAHGKNIYSYKECEGIAEETIYTTTDNALIWYTEDYEEEVKETKLYKWLMEEETKPKLTIQDIIDRSEGIDRTNRTVLSKEEANNIYIYSNGKIGFYNIDIEETLHFEEKIGELEDIVITTGNNYASKINKSKELIKWIKEQLEKEQSEEKHKQKEESNSIYGKYIPNITISDFNTDSIHIKATPKYNPFTSNYRQPISPYDYAMNINPLLSDENIQSIINSITHTHIPTKPKPKLKPETKTKEKEKGEIMKISKRTQRKIKKLKTQQAIVVTGFDIQKIFTKNFRGITNKKINRWMKVNDIKNINDFASEILNNLLKTDSIEVKRKFRKTLILSLFVISQKELIKKLTAHYEEIKNIKKIKKNKKSLKGLNKIK